MFHRHIWQVTETVQDPEYGLSQPVIVHGHIVFRKLFPVFEHVTCLRCARSRVRAKMEIRDFAPDKKVYEER